MQAGYGASEEIEKLKFCIEIMEVMKNEFLNQNKPQNYLKTKEVIDFLIWKIKQQNNNGIQREI